jgi:hypothetical protein
LADEIDLNRAAISKVLPFRLLTFAKIGLDVCLLETELAPVERTVRDHLPVHSGILTITI